MLLKPSDIRFSQDSINNYFDKRSNHSRKTIGETLDDLCERRCLVDDIPTITVVKEGGFWITADNRRLWLFRELERLGKCDTIPVRRGYSIPDAKRTSYNGGTSITVRRNPGGFWYLKPSVGVRSADRLTRHDPPSPIHDMESIQSRLRRLHTSPRGIPFQTSTEARRTVVTPALATPQPNTANVIPTVSRVSRDFRRPTSAVEELRALTLESRTDNISEVGPFGTRIARYTYGIYDRRSFVQGIHPEAYRTVIDGKIICDGCFSIYVKKGQQIEVGQSFVVKRYYTSSSNPVQRISIYRSDEPNPMFVDEASCLYIGQLTFDFLGNQKYDKKGYDVKMVYDGAELCVKVRVRRTGKVFRKNIH